MSEHFSLIFSVEFEPTIKDALLEMGVLQQISQLRDGSLHIQYAFYSEDAWLWIMESDIDAELTTLYDDSPKLGSIFSEMLSSEPSAFVVVERGSSTEITEVSRQFITNLSVRFEFILYSHIPDAEFILGSAFCNLSNEEQLNFLDAYL